MGEFQSLLVAGFETLNNELSPADDKGLLSGKNFLFTFDDRVPAIIVTESDDTAIQHVMEIEFRSDLLKGPVPKIGDRVKIGRSESTAEEWKVAGYSRAQGNPISTLSLADFSNEF